MVLREKIMALLPRIREELKKIAKPVDISKQEMTQEAVDKIVNDFSSLLRNDTYKVYAWEEMSHQSLRFLVEYAGKVMGYQD